MSNVSPSLEDLIKNDYSDEDELTPQEKLNFTMKDIRIKELEKETRKAAQSLGMSYIDLKGFVVSPEVLVLIPKETSKKLQIISFFQSSGELRLGMVNPDNKKIIPVIKKIEKEKYYKVAPYLISKHSFKSAFKLYDAIPKIKITGKGVQITEKDLDKFREQVSSLEGLNKQIQRVPITEVVTLITAAAIKSRASDIHIEAEEKNIKVRLRIDGILHTVATLSAEH